MKAPVAYLLIAAVLGFVALTTCSKLNVNQNPPDVPSAPSPASGDALDSVAIELSWTCSDPDGDPLSYDVYLDTSAIPEVLVATVDTTSYTPERLHYNYTYYWKIVATDTTGLATEGPVWSFSFGADMIAPSCSLIAPNGGELWYVGFNRTITWDAEDDDGIDYYVLEYSINGGDNWIAIGDTIGGGNQDTSWTIPPTASPQCLVRISCYDFGGNAISDTSDSIFMIWPQGGMIAFTSDRDGAYDIFTMYADGLHLRNLTNSHPSDTCQYPDWSPDCSKIVFEFKALNGNYEIYTMNYDGTAKSNISNNPESDRYPRWSPLGDKIAFVSNRRITSITDIYTMNVDGTGINEVTMHNWLQEGPDWSPTGEQIVYHDEQYGAAEIFVIDSEGFTGRVRLTDNGWADTWPSWSPDGLLIAFQFYNTINWCYDIRIMNANGTSPQLITYSDYEDHHPSWSPDGSKIVFQSYRTGDWEIWTVDPNNTSDLQNISDDLSDDQHPSWSPIH